MKAVDFFCGAGGLTKGLSTSGVEVVAGIDINANCKETYELNNSPAKFICADMRQLNLDALLEIDTRLLADPDNLLFAGCAPCQPFSQHRKSKEPRPDATVLSDFGKLVELVKPGQILIENVPGIARVKGYSTFKRFLKLLKENGYNYVYGVLDAKKYGVPQNRLRLVLIAARGLQVSLPSQTHGESLLPYRTVRNAIERYPEIGSGECHPYLPNHTAAEIEQMNMQRLENTPHDGGDRLCWPEHLKLKCHTSGHRGHTDVYGRMFWDKPAPTLTGKCNSISNGRYGHPVQNRAISLREAAAIQTFPDDYIFHGTKSQVALHIGNAVPVLLGKVLGTHILNLRRRSN